MKMNNHLFSEVYGCYFTMVKRILEQAEIGFTRSEMEAMVQADGFYDTAFHLLPKLFSEEIETLKDIPPLFLQSDFHLYDSAADGDPYEKKHYINIFLTILKTCTNQTPLSIHYKSGKQNLARILYAEYSSANIEKKFNISKFFRETVCKEPIMLEISK